MKSFQKILANQQGMSMLFMVMVVSLAVGGIAFVTTDMIPKLQGEKKKAEATIAYRVFVGSLNDYLVHGIREKWCLNYNKNNGTSDLLLSNDCASDKPMETIVTYPGNLERVLWGPENIGTKLSAPPSLEQSNKILSLNYLRYYGNPQKSNRLLDYNDVRPPEGKLRFKITQAVLQDMTNLHPLYVMANKIKDCVNEINIEIFQVNDYNNVGGGEERKIGIHITSDIIKTRYSCMVLKQADSISYYTFYPRRLHTFSLIKYGNLDGKLHNEYHGPVYVAGDFVLPPASTDKAKASVFYNTLTLGIFNEGKGDGSIYQAGRILKSDRNVYTFDDRGHPYRSKQDNYENFRGFLGGVRLDSSEDKGFHNLFDYSSVSSGDVSTLEACIEENNALLRPSANWNSTLAYTNFNSTPDSAQLKLSFTERNRFKPSDQAGQPNIDYNNTKEIKTKDGGWFKDDIKYEVERRFLFDVKSPEGNRAEGGISLHYDRVSYGWGSSGDEEEDYYGTLGVDSVAEIGLNLAYYKLTSSKMTEFINKVETANRYNYYNVIDSGHVLYNTKEAISFREEANDLNNSCRYRPSEHCKDFGYSPTCDSSKDKSCDYSRDLEKYIEKRDALKSELESIKTTLDTKVQPLMTVTLKNVEPYNSKTVLNQRYLAFTFSPEWKKFYSILRTEMKNVLNFRFTPYHYGHYTLSMGIRIEGNEGSSLKWWSPYYSTAGLNYGGWRRASNNQLLDDDEQPKPLIELDCPDGMGVADWDLDMSASANFAWNYANTPPGAQIDSNDHESAPPIVFYPGEGSDPPMEGHAPSTTKSVVEECTIPADRTHVYGFYVCNRLVIEPRTAPLYMVGTFIVNELVQAPEQNAPVHWHSVWDTKATDLIMADLNATKEACGDAKILMDKTWVDLINSSKLESKLKSCSPLDLVANGPNNFSWTTVDPDVGIAKAGDVMTSQKANRVQKWIIREESRVDMIR